MGSRFVADLARCALPVGDPQAPRESGRPRGGYQATRGRLTDDAEVPLAARVSLAHSGVLTALVAYSRSVTWRITWTAVGLINAAVFWVYLDRQGWGRKWLAVIAALLLGPIIWAWWGLVRYGERRGRRRANRAL